MPLTGLHEVQGNNGNNNGHKDKKEEKYSTVPQAYKRTRKHEITHDTESTAELSLASPCLASPFATVYTCSLTVLHVSAYPYWVNVDHICVQTSGLLNLRYTTMINDSMKCPWNGVVWYSSLQWSDLACIQCLFAR